MIDWEATQTRLGIAADGIPGRGTYTALLRVVGPDAGAAVIKSLANACVVHLSAYGVDQSVTRLADFLAQTANETGGFTAFSEKLGYSAKRLTEVWPKRFPTIAVATPYANNPQKLANKTYADRMGNGAESSGDGWAYRGRGMLQLTGRSNYEATDKRLGIGLDTNPDLAAVPALSLLIACDFYRHNHVFEALDRGNTDRARAITNGGDVGLAHVNALRATLLKVLR